MLQNSRVRAFNVSELLRENQQGVKLPPTQIRVKHFVFRFYMLVVFLDFNLYFFYFFSGIIKKVIKCVVRFSSSANFVLK